MKSYCNNYNNGLHVQKNCVKIIVRKKIEKTKKLSCKVVGDKLSVNLQGNRFLLL